MRRVILIIILLTSCAAAKPKWDCWQWSSKTSEHGEPTFLGLALYKVGVTRLLGVHCVRVDAPKKSRQAKKGSSR